MNDADYYSGLLFQGFIKEARETILYGGRYDRLMSRQGKRQGAIGFGLKLNHVGQKLPSDNQSSEYLNVALPKGEWEMRCMICSPRPEWRLKVSLKTIAN